MPSCSETQRTTEYKLKGHVGFSQLKREVCNEVMSTDMWLCECGIQWHKCGKHVHSRFFPKEHLQVHDNKLGVKIIPKLSARGIKRKFPVHGIDRPMPKKKGIETTHFEGAKQDWDRPFLEPHSKLAAKFPRLVKS